MISLRGPVRRRDGGQWEWTGVWAFGNLPEDSFAAENTPATASGSSKVASKGQRSKNGRSNRRSSNKKAPGHRSFRYTFREPKDASKVPIPWYDEISTVEESATDGPANVCASSESHQQPKSGETFAESLPKSENASTGINGLSNGTTDCRDNCVQQGQQRVNGQRRVVSSTESSPSSSPVRTPQESEDSCNRPQPEGTVDGLCKDKLGPQQSGNGDGEESSVVTNSSNRADTASPVGASDGDVVVVVSTPLNQPENKVPVASKKGCLGDVPGSSLEKAAAQVTPRASLPVGCATSSERNVNNIPNEKRESSGSEATSDIRTDAASAVSKDISGEVSQRNNSESSKVFRSREENEEQEEVKVATFASLTLFKDAGLEKPETCPVGGIWAGYFENVQTRKDRKSSRVSESFYLYFNALLPDSEDRRAYPYALPHESDGLHAGLDIMTTDAGKRNFFHIRGMGSNQFGTFELVGLLNVASGILRCQRVYVETPDDTEALRQNKRGSQSKAKRNKKQDNGKRNGSSSPGGLEQVKDRPYFTRKRQMSWQRHDASSSDDDRDDERHRLHRANRKRKDSLGDTFCHSFPGPLNGDRRVDTGVPSSPLSHASKKKPLSLTIKAPLGLPSCRSTDGSDGACSIGRSASGPTSPTSKKARLGGSTSVMALPPTADSTSCRWKGAHFFSRTKIQTDSAAGCSSSSDWAENVAQCIYEGELCYRNGHAMREGYGVCVYENGNIYEGSWRRSKEHGTGILFTGDREHVIYEGDWERGRMHGKGVYYYSGPETSDAHKGKNEKQSVPDVSLQSQRVDRGGGVYRGDFKENCRHGWGHYTLPDGSVYEGEWRDNVQCGRGNFYWMDGSCYKGQWKNGQRHGIGTLTSSDGFLYEGQWVANAMEGRGWCQYPTGQRYEGLWAKGRKEGRGTVIFSNGAVYEGRFKDDRIEGQGTMKIANNVVVCPEDSVYSQVSVKKETSEEEKRKKETQNEECDWLIPVQFQSDMGHIHQRAGFTKGGS